MTDENKAMPEDFETKDSPEGRAKAVASARTLLAQATAEEDGQFIVFTHKKDPAGGLGGISSTCAGGPVFMGASAMTLLDAMMGAIDLEEEDPDPGKLITLIYLREARRFIRKAVGKNVGKGDWEEDAMNERAKRLGEILGQMTGMDPDALREKLTEALFPETKTEGNA